VPKRETLQEAVERRKRKNEELERQRAAQGGGDQELESERKRREDKERREAEANSRGGGVVRNRRASLRKLPIPIAASVLTGLAHLVNDPDIRLHIETLGWQREMAFGAFLKTFSSAPTSTTIPGTSASHRATHGPHAALAFELFTIFEYLPPSEKRYAQEAERRLQPTRPTLMDALEVEVRTRFHALVVS
jgi:hypothetical protein